MTTTAWTATPRDWQLQLHEPRERLEQATGRPVVHFAYPYGVWAASAFEHLEAAGYKTAFQLSDEQVDAAAPPYTLRRILVDSNWLGDEVLQQIRQPG